MKVDSDISVVIRTCNSGGAVRSLLGLLRLSARDEIIVVDSGSTDNTVPLAKAAGARIILNQGVFRYSSALNLGFAAARNPWILSLSAHCLPAGDLLEEYRKAIDLYDARAVMFNGSIVASRKQAQMQLREKPVLLGPDRLLEPKTGGNGNRLYLKSTWKLHPFDESIPRAEDAEWMIWAGRQGYCAVQVSAACVLYRNPGSLKYMFNKGFGDATVCFENGHRPRKISLRSLLIAFLSHTKHYLFLEHSPRLWLGQLFQSFGAFVGSRAGASNGPRTRVKK